VPAVVLFNLMFMYPEPGFAVTCLADTDAPFVPACLFVPKSAPDDVSELVSFSVTPAEGGASGFVIAVAVR
jgi:hypothetical protein